MSSRSALVFLVAFACTRAPDAEAPGGSCADTDPPGESDTGEAPDPICADEAGVFPAVWIRGGPDCGSEPEIQVHRYSENVFVLRQSLCTSFEAPFLFLIFGADRVLLEDTGAGGIQIAGAVDDVIATVLDERGQDRIDLLVVNSHAHGDHTAGNGQFEGRPRTTVIGTRVSDRIEAFGLDDWPDDQAEIDLGGGRVIDLLPIPGHEDAHVALYDRASGLLLTGDTLYPGRLYIDDFSDYRDSLHRLTAFAGALEICHVLGTHVEMTTTPGEDYDFGVTNHPQEHPLALSVSHLYELEAGVDAMGNQPRREVHDDFVITPL